MMQEEIQAAIYTAVAAIGYPTYDHVPQTSSYPYIVIGDDTSITYDTDTSVGSETTCTIHVWSQARGRKQVKEIMRGIYEALHRADFDIQSGSLVSCDAEYEETFVESDGLTRHGVTRYRLIVEAADSSDVFLASESGALLQTEAGFYIVKD